LAIVSILFMALAANPGRETSVKPAAARDLIGKSLCAIPKEVPTYGLPIGEGFLLKNIRFEGAEVVALVAQSSGAAECTDKILAVLNVPAMRRGEFIVLECWHAASKRRAIVPGIVAVGTNLSGRRRQRIFVPRLAWSADTKTNTFHKLDAKTVKCELAGED
jgi:hypothetical protein